MALNITDRTAAGEALVPPEVTNTVIQQLPTQSLMLSMATQVRMSAAKQIQPVLSTLPEAYWVNGDTGLKETSKAAWEGLTMTAEELAVIVPIPDAVIDDASVDLWEQIRPLLVAALGKKIDQATIFGVNKPSSWPDHVLAGADTAGNAVQVAAKKNLADATVEAAEKLAAQGFSVNAFGARPGLSWKLRGLKDDNGAYYYGAPSVAGQPGTLFGYRIMESGNGAWDAAKADLVMADWTKFIIGIRQDMTFEMFREGVITDSAGKVLLNLMQQDTKAMRVVMRLGFQVANPVSPTGEAKHYPAGYVKPAASPGVGG